MSSYSSFCCYLCWMIPIVTSEWSERTCGRLRLTCTWRKLSVIIQTVLPTLRFSREFGLIFLWSCGFFGDLRIACFWACFNWNLLVFWACFLRISVLRIAFFQILWHFCCFNFLLKAYWACFYENSLILGLFFRLCLPAFLFNFLADFSFCWIFLPTHVGLVFG